VRSYLIKTPRLLKATFSSCIWHIKNSANSVYLTFDDGPHPIITPFVLDILKQFNAKATFFCIGKNVADHPEVYQRVIDEGHAIGNHTYHHVNSWKVKSEQYLENIIEAERIIQSNLFRPPYGKLTSSALRRIKNHNPKTKVVMWDVLTGDFDTKLSPQDCLKHTINSTETGSIIVFHDSEKAFERLAYALPRFMKYAANKKWQFKKLNF
jgi:peptidoglycan-N-acetylglucosamine deacetylase